MKTLKFIFALIFFAVIYFTATAQTENTIDSLQKIEQKCSTSGWRMQNCSFRFMNQMDSILNITYNKLRLSLGCTQKIELEKEQKNWSKKRYIFFNQTDKKFEDSLKSGDWGPEMRAVTYEEKAEFIKDRVLTLIKERQKE